jgi:mannose-1-phosphate guanylyltransferase
MSAIRGMLVAAGFGTRLAPLTDELPKPAVPVANRPVAAFALEALARAGVRDVVVNTHHLPVELEWELTPFCPPGATLRYVHEERILGTGGGVYNAWASSGGPQEGEDFVVMNAKLVFAPNITRALAAHRESGAVATMILRPLPQGTTFAAVEHDEDGRIRRIRGRPSTGDEQTLFRAMFTGVQILSERAFEDLPRDGDVIDGAYLRWLERGDRVQAVLDDSPWLDVGVTVEHYLQANMALARREIVWPGIEPDAAGNIIHPLVHVPASAQLENVVIGRGAVIPEGAELTRVVAWQEAKLPTRLRDAVVTSGGLIARI